MKRMHVHVAVDDLSASINFYSALFATEPSVVKSDYAKWMLEDPRVNFAISTRGRAPGLDHLGIQVESQAELHEVYARLAQGRGPRRAPGLDHLGIQVESQAELHEVYARLRQAGGTVVEQGAAACCYAKSEKSW